MLDDSSTAEVDLQQLAAKIELALSKTTEVELGPMLDAYQTLLLEQDELCPSWNTNAEGLPYWAATCSTEGNVQFSGYGMSTITDGRVDSSGNVWSGSSVYGEGEISDGVTALTLGGGLEVLSGVSANGQELMFQYSHAGTQLSSPNHELETLELSQWAVRDWEDSSRSASVGMAAVVHLEDAEETIVTFADLVYNARYCNGEPAGSTQIRSGDHWVSLYWDATEPLEESLCDGCATAWVDGASLGRICVDFSQLQQVGPWVE